MLFNRLRQASRDTISKAFSRLILAMTESEHCEVRSFLIDCIRGTEAEGERTPA